MTGIIKTIVVIAVVAGIAAGVYFYFFKNKC